MKFQRIVAVDPCGLQSPYREEILKLSTLSPLTFDDYPQTREEIIRRIGDADCLLVSWNTIIDAEVISACPSLRYIGMCCSLYDEQSANVSISEARKRGIEVRGVKDYGDEGTVEFIFAQLISLLKGLGEQQWLEEATELTGKTIGIIGMGTLGRMVAEMALHWQMNVCYFSRTRKPEIEQKGVSYYTLEELLPQCDIVTIHLPRNNCLLRGEEFSRMKANAILVNTSLGQPFDPEAFLAWIKEAKSNYAIFDGPGQGGASEQYVFFSNILASPVTSGFTREAKARLSRKVLQNMEEYLCNAYHNRHKDISSPSITEWNQSWNR